MFTKPTIGIGILSWRAHKTLRQSLDSYRDNGFLDLFDQKLIYFSDMSDDDIAIAHEYGWEHAGGPNEGIAGGMKRLGENLKTDFIVLLQNDNPICESADVARQMVKGGLGLLMSDRADIVRLRHRWKVGEGFADVSKYLKYYPVHQKGIEFEPQEHELKSVSYSAKFKKMLMRLLRPVKASRLRGRSVFIEQYPDQVHPNVIHQDGDFYIIDSSALPFTDQCLFLSRKLWLDTFCPYVDTHPDSGRSSGGFPAPERSINGAWWRNTHFRIAQGQGIFTHNRFDGSFREGHRGFEKVENNA